MKILKGIGVSPGYAIGEAVVFEREEMLVHGRFVPSADVEAEVGRFEKAVEQVGAALQRLRDEVKGDLGERVSGIFESYRWVLDDPSFRESVTKRIRSNRFSAEYAVDRTFKRYIQRLKVLEDSHFSQRARDFEDLQRQVVEVLSGQRAFKLEDLSRPVVAVAMDLPPSQLASVGRKWMLGLATDLGGRTSHAAILARDYGIPTVVGLQSATVDVSAGEMVIVDGSRGLLIISPDEGTLARYRALKAEFADFEQGLLERSRRRVSSADGEPVSVLANMEFPEELEPVLSSGADGLGLFRTEFLFLSSNRMPSEDEHAEVYAGIASRLAGRPMVVRTFDLGADKLMLEQRAEYSRERNPALGLRGVRLYRAYPEVFRAQVAAIYRASASGDARLLVPMVSSIEEVRWVKEMCREVQRELRRRQVAFNPEMPLGIMIETPAAAMAVDILAAEVDFLSIGTNDLIQYALAVDRSNERVAPTFQPLHPAVLRLVKAVIEGGREAGREVAMCGEMAGEWMYGLLLLGLGLRVFSVSSAAVPEVKALISQVSMQEARETASEVLKISDPQDAFASLERINRRLLPELFRYVAGRQRF